MRRTTILALTALFALTFAGVADSRMSERAPSRSIVVGQTDRTAAMVAAEVKAVAENPLLIVGGIPDGTVTAKTVASFRGRVGRAATLTVNGEPVEIEKLGFWKVTLPLVEGENTFTFAATNADGGTTTVVRHVTHDPSMELSSRPADNVQKVSDQVRQPRGFTRDRH